MTSYLLTTGVAILAFLAILSAILCAVAAVMLSSRISQHEEDPNQ